MSSAPLSSSDNLALPTPELGALQALLEKVVECTPTVREKTFFSIGRRGHWENPASDVLAFFLNPREQHGFGSLFLRVFFKCMGVDAAGLDLETGVQVQVEERLPSDERIDIVVRASGWVLAIENKIYHWVANDLDAYATHVRHIARVGRQVHLALVAPEDDQTHADWRPVTYRDFCAALITAFDETFPRLPASKWQVFAREFTAHLLNLLYPVRMQLDPAQLALMEGHLAQVTVLKQLSTLYDEFLVHELQTRLARTLPARSPFVFQVDHWALYCDSAHGEKWRLTLQTPVHNHASNFPGKFVASVCLSSGASDDLYRRARQAFAELNIYHDSGEWWESPHEDRESAVAKLCEMARLLFTAD